MPFKADRLRSYANALQTTQMCFPLSAIFRLLGFSGRSCGGIEKRVV